MKVKVSRFESLEAAHEACLAGIDVAAASAINKSPPEILEIHRIKASDAEVALETGGDYGLASLEDAPMILRKSAEWATRLKRIEALRIKGKQAVRAAPTSVEAVRARRLYVEQINAM